MQPLGDSEWRGVVVFYTEKGQIYRRCAKCKEILPLSSFYRQKRVRYRVGGYCKSCNSDWLSNYGASPKGREIKRRANRSYWPQYYQENRDRLQNHKKENHQPGKARTGNIVCAALKSGKLIKPDACSKCGKSWCQIQAHHEDYNKPLEVIWLCKSCHRRKHNGEKSKNEEKT